MKVRLNRYLSQCGAASRRKADELISRGEVSVNGEVVRELGVVVDPEIDVVELGGVQLNPEKKRYLVLNKPKLYITALGEGEDEKSTIEELIRGIPERVYPVGRLDFDVEGLLILTNDGELANRIHHPRYELSKLYRAQVRGSVSKELEEKMRGGTELEDGFVKPDSLRITKRSERSSTVEVAFHEGRNHLVKRFFKEYGRPVERLQRISVGPIKLGSLEKGKWRDLGAGELKQLRTALGL